MLHMRSQPIPRQTGFTTIEMMIVIVIIGVGAAISMPRIGPVVSRERVRRGSTEIATFLEYAFAVAARTDKPVSLTYNTTTGVVKLADRASGDVIRQMALTAGSEYQFQSVTVSPSTAVILFPSGMSSSAITITAGTQGFTKTISASRAGQVRVQ